MQMIDVLKRLAELDAKNPNVVKESSNLEECGMMPMPGMAELESAEPEKPAHPATLNITAGSGEELSNMLTAIMQLAGVKKVGADDLGQEHDPMTLTAEPSLTATPDIGGDDMRSMMSVVDKLNPEPEDSDDGMSADQGDVDNDGDHDMDDHEAEKEKEKEDEGMYSNSPDNPNDKPPFDANKFANQENKPGQGDRMDGNMPTANVKRMEESLMAQYKAFLGEADDTETETETDEGVMDKVKAGVKAGAKAVGKAIMGPDDEELIQRLEKETGGKRPAHIPTPVKSNESMEDILKLSGLVK